MESRGGYSHEDALLAWLDQPSDAFFMGFRSTERGRQLTEEEVRNALQTLVRFNLARVTMMQPRSTGPIPLRAEITGLGLIVLREHSGHIHLWRMSEKYGGGRSDTPPSNTYYTTIAGDAPGAQIAVAGGAATQVRAGHDGEQGTGPLEPDEWERRVQDVVRRSIELTTKYPFMLPETKEIIEDAGGMALSLLREARSRDDDDSERLVSAARSRLGRILRYLQQTVAEENDDREATLQLLIELERI